MRVQVIGGVEIYHQVGGTWSGNHLIINIIIISSSSVAVTVIVNNGIISLSIINVIMWFWDGPIL